MGIELRGAKVGVSEHLLDAAQIGSSFEEGGGEGMAEQVRVDALGVQPRLDGQAAEDEERAGAGQRSALRVQEELWAVAPVEVGAAAAEIAAERLGGLATDRDDAFLVTLADAAHESVLEVDGAALETDRL